MKADALRTSWRRKRCLARSISPPYQTRTGLAFWLVYTECLTIVCPADLQPMPNVLLRQANCSQQYVRPPLGMRGDTRELWPRPAIPTGARRRLDNPQGVSVQVFAHESAPAKEWNDKPPTHAGRPHRGDFRAARNLIEKAFHHSLRNENSLFYRMIQTRELARKSAECRDGEHGIESEHPELCATGSICWA